MIAVESKEAANNFFNYIVS